PGDEWDTVDTAGMVRIAGLVEDVLRRVGDAERPLTHVAGAGTPPGEQTAGYGAYRGTVPEFTPVDVGLRRSGVSGGSPAEAAGLRGGDVLLRLGDYEIEDLYVLTEALQEIPPGTVVDAVVLRDGERLTFTVTLGER